MIALNFSSRERVFRIALSLLMSVLFEVLFKSYLDHTDGEIYSRVCESMADQGVLSAFNIFVEGYAGIEPASFLFLYFPCYLGLNFSVANIAANVILIYSILRLQRNDQIALAALIVSTNFYFLVLGFGAFRLKLAVAFFILSKSATTRRWRALAVCFSGLAHFQMLIVLIAEFSSHIVRTVRMRSNSHALFVVSIAALLTISSLVLGVSSWNGALIDYFQGKVEFYEDLGVFSYKLLILFLLSLYIFGYSRRYLFIFLALSVAALAFGDGRINILFFACMGIDYLKDTAKLQSGLTRMQNLVFLALCAYFSIQGFALIHSLIEGYSYFLDNVR